MTTLGQTLANQENAQKSTGPKSEAGKAAVAQNGVKHGMRAEKILVKAEDREAFEEFAAAYRAELAPQTVQQMEMAERIVGLVWKVQRSEELETALWNSGGGTIEDMAVMLGTHARELDLILRYGKEAERKLSRAREEYRRLQADQARREEAAARKAAAAAQAQVDEKRRKEEDYWAEVKSRMLADMAKLPIWEQKRKEGMPLEKIKELEQQTWQLKYSEEIVKARKLLGRPIGKILADSYYEELAQLAEEGEPGAEKEVNP